MASNTANFLISSVRLSMRLAHVYPAFDANILRRIVAAAGFTWTAEDLPKGTIGLEAIHRGRVAIKDDVALEFNNDKQVLGIAGESPDKVLDAFTVVKTTLQEAIEPTKLNVFFFETVLTALAQGTKSPLEVFSSDSNTFKKSDALEKIFGTSVSPLSLRLSPPNVSVDNTDWFEYKIEPLNYQPENIYSVTFIYRNKSMDKVKEASLGFEKMTRGVISTLEK